MFLTANNLEYAKQWTKGVIISYSGKGPFKWGDLI